MERLTFKVEDRFYIENPERVNGKIVGTRRCLQKLGELEDLQEQGLLLKLPCKVGDKAYYIHKNYLANEDKWINVIDEVEVDSFVVYEKILVNASLYIRCDRFAKTLTPYKTLFFTKEEAEAKLKEMGCE